MDAADLFSVILVIPVTVTSQDAVTPEPSVAVAVMVAVPILFAVILPFWLTVATVVLLDFNVTVGLSASDGKTVILRV